MAIDPSLLRLLACPDDDHAPLTPTRRSQAEVLQCTSCGKAFPIDGDIPVLLLEDALPAEGAVPAAGQQG